MNSELVPTKCFLGEQILTFEETNSNQNNTLQIPSPFENFGYFQGGDLYKIQFRAAPVASFCLVELTFQNCIEYQ